MEDFTRIIYNGFLIEQVDISRATLNEALSFKNRLEEDIVYGHRNIIVDLNSCEFIDSTFIGVLVLTMKKLKKRAGSLKIVKPKLKGFIDSLENVSPFLNNFTIYDSIEEAIKSNQNTNFPGGLTGFSYN